MSIVFNCNSCQSELRVQESAAGKRARCPRCGMIHDVPQSSEALQSQLSGESSLTPHLDASAADEQSTVYQTPPADESFQITGYERWSMKTPDGAVYGPVDREELDSWAAEGRVSSACLVQSEGQSHWQSAVALYPQLAGATVTPPASSQKSYTGPNSQYGHRHYVGTQPRSTHRRVRPNNGVAVFVMGILGIVFVFVPVFALIAWSMGHNERNAIHRHEASSDGRWMVDAGYGLGIVGSVIGCLIFFSCCVSISN